MMITKCEMQKMMITLQEKLLQRLENDENLHDVAGGSGFMAVVRASIVWKVILIMDPHFIALKYPINETVFMDFLNKSTADSFSQRVVFAPPSLHLDVKNFMLELWNERIHPEHDNNPVSCAPQSLAVASTPHEAPPVSLHFSAATTSSTSAASSMGSSVLSSANRVQPAGRIFN